MSDTSGPPEPDTNIDRKDDRSFLTPEHAERLFRRHLRGAYARSGGVFGVWLLFLIAWFAGTFDTPAFRGLSVSGGFLVLMNIPTLWILKRIRRRRVYEAFSLFINLLEVTAHTSVIYFGGGLRSSYLVLVYAAVITYVGVVASRRITFLVGAFSIAGFTTIVGLEHAGIIPHQNAVWPYTYSLNDVIAACTFFGGLLGTVGFMAGFSGTLLRKSRDELRKMMEERKRTVLELRTRTRELGERIKDLNCMYGISKVTEKPGVTFEGILKEVVELIPPAWQYPEDTCARVVFQDAEFRTGNFQETVWVQAAPILVVTKPSTSGGGPG